VRQQGMLTEMTHLALPTAWNARRPGEPAHMNSVRNLIPQTDRPTNRPRTLGQPSRAGIDGRPRVRGCCIEKWTEVQRRWRAISMNFIISC